MELLILQTFCMFSVCLGMLILTEMVFGTAKTLDVVCNYDVLQCCQILDVVGVCGGACETDEDQDGVCACMTAVAFHLPWPDLRNSPNRR